MSVPVIVLAAGASTRFGSPKQLAVFGSETLIHRAIRIAREAGLAPIVVVLGSRHAEILAEIPSGPIIPVINHQWADGMSGSVRLGLAAVIDAAKDAAGVVLMTCDQPAVTAPHLEKISSGREIKASRYAGRNGVPAFFPRKDFEALMALQGDAGARDLLRAAPSEELPGGELDIDTPQNLDQARLLYGHA